MITCDDVRIDVAVAKGRMAHQQLIDQNSKTIVVEFIRITLLLVYFRRNRVCSSTDCVGSFLAYLFSMS